MYPSSLTAFHQRECKTYLAGNVHTKWRITAFEFFRKDLDLGLNDKNGMEWSVWSGLRMEFALNLGIYSEELKTGTETNHCTDLSLVLGE